MVKTNNLTLYCSNNTELYKIWMKRLRHGDSGKSILSRSHAPRSETGLNQYSQDAEHSSTCVPTRSVEMRNGGIIFMVLNVTGQLFLFYSRQTLGKGILLMALGSVFLAGMIWFNIRREAILKLIISECLRL